MHHFEKKIPKNSPEGSHENVWGPRENVSPGIAVTRRTWESPVGAGCELDRMHCQTVGGSRTERSAAMQ